MRPRCPSCHHAHLPHEIVLRCRGGRGAQLGTMLVIFMLSLLLVAIGVILDDRPVREVMQDHVGVRLLIPGPAVVTDAAAVVPERG